MSFLDRTVQLEELIGALGGAPPSTGGAGSSGTGSNGSGASDDGAGDQPAPDPVDSPATSSAGPALAAAGDSVPASSSTLPGREAATAEEPDPAAPSLPTTDDPVEAWGFWLEGGSDFPRGLRPYLHAAEVATDDDGRLLVRVPAGPATERLDEPAVRANIAEGLARHLGHRPELRVEALGEAPAPERRLTVEDVRSDTLKALYRQEPRLERAVQGRDRELRH